MFHCYSNYGSINDPTAKDWTVPMKTVNSLGYSSHEFIFKNITKAYIDLVEWP